MVRSGHEWSADQVLVGVEGDYRQETGAVISNEEQVSRAVLSVIARGERAAPAFAHKPTCWECRDPTQSER